jgi:rubrerythrin
MNRLLNAIIDEKKAPKQYRKISRFLTIKRDRKIIKGIIRDERRHLNMLKKIKRRYKK